MKKLIVTGAIILGLQGACMADFAKTSTYTEGQFTDVPATEWYASSVKDAYEFGLMNGDSASTFSPDGTLTVAEGITITSRIHAIANGKDIPDAKGAEWYQKYVDYSVANGLMEEGQFDGYDFNIKRFEIAELFASAVSLPAINSVSELPDVASGVTYADDVLELYNAGILTGNDSYGTFAPNSYLKRSEISAMAVRIADASKRVKKDFDKIDARAFSDSYHIIETVIITGKNGLANGWNYDNRFDVFNTNGIDMYALSDSSDEKFYSLKRDFDPEYEGLLSLELVFQASSSDNGTYISLENAEGDRIAEVTSTGGMMVLKGKTDVVTDIPFDTTKTRDYVITAEIDLDKNTAEFIVDNKFCGKIDVAEDAVISRLVLGTNKKGTGVIALKHARLVKNRVMSEHFLAKDEFIGGKPAGWNVSGDFKLDKMLSEKGEDVYSVKAEAKSGSISKAEKKLQSVTGKICFETYVLFPEKTDGGKVALMSGDTEVFAFETKNGKIVMGENELHDYVPNVWQLLYIEADTNTGKAIIKINGKEKAEISFNARVFDGVKIEFAPKNDAVMWFDDVEVYNIIDHADYPSEPVVAKSNDYNVGIHFCYLWRDTQSGEGWDATSPFPELDTYLGFYDEGLRESADWELKMLAEHGVDFIHVCWYCPNGYQDVPIKRMRVSHSALHDGYMNAKYSDLVDFCIMWENNGNDVTSLEQFKSYIWPFWKEYYFADERYARLDNKAVLTVWDKSNMKKHLGGDQGVKDAIDFMNSELKSMGYDGLIILERNQSKVDESFYQTVEATGLDGTYAYSYGREGYDPEYQIAHNNHLAKVSENASSHHVPTISAGFNDVARNEVRVPIITAEDFLKVCEDAKNILSSYNTGTWMDNTVILSTWNEYSEGTYIMPSEGNGGFAYLEAVRKAFTDDTSDHTSLDAKLTETQLDRVGHLYPANHSPIRWHMFETADGAEEIDKNDTSLLVPARSYDMSKAESKDSWEELFGLDTYEFEGGVMKGSAEGLDYGIITKDLKPFAADSASIIHIRMKNSTKADMQIYFLTSSDGSWGGKKQMTVPITNAGEFVDYYINMKPTGVWEDEIISVRIDPMTAAGDFEISTIEFMNFPTSTGPVVKINDVEAVFTFNPVLLSDGDFEIVGEARHKGFYSAMRLYHEWDRFTGDGVLTLYDRNENEYVFAVGSDKVKVNGEERNAGFTFKLRDGLPVFHIKKLCDLLGYKYMAEGNVVNVISASADEADIIQNQVGNRWEFDYNSTEGWSGRGGNAVCYDGCFILNANYVDLGMLRTVSLKASDYTHIVIGIECQKELMDKDTPQLFFTTKTSGSWSADKCINGKYNTEGKNDGDVIEVIFNLADNPLFAGTVTALRFDPYSAVSDFRIDYIRCVNDPSLTPEEVLFMSDEYKWDFDKKGDIEGWSTRGCGYNVENGIAKITPINSDPGMIMENLSINASAFQYMIVGVKYTESLKKAAPELFFLTDADSSWGTNKNILGQFEIPDDVKPGDIVEVRFKLNLNTRWSGRITAVRFDPFSATDDYEVDYIGFYTNNENSLSNATASGSTTTPGSSDEITYVELDDENQWFFDDDGEVDGWGIKGGAKHTVKDGTLKVEAKDSDPGIIREDVSFYASSYQYVVIGMKYTETLKDATAEFFFITDENSSWAADKRLQATYKIPSDAKNGDMVEVVFDLTRNPQWKGKVIGIRFDPLSSTDGYEIDYVRFCIKSIDMSETSTDTPAAENTDSYEEISYVEVFDENRWDFDTDESVDGWGLKGGPKYTVSGGILQVEAKDSDPGIVRDDVSFYATSYQYMVVGIKYTDALKNATPEFFFITEDDPNWSSDKRIQAIYKIPSDVRDGDVIEAIVVLNKNSKWAGKVTGIRFDPFAVTEGYEIDYVKFCIESF